MILVGSCIDEVHLTFPLLRETRVSLSLSYFRGRDAVDVLFSFFASYIYCVTVLYRTWDCLRTDDFPRKIECNWRLHSNNHLNLFFFFFQTLAKGSPCFVFQDFDSPSNDYIIKISITKIIQLYNILYNIYSTYIII